MTSYLVDVRYPISNFDHYLKVFKKHPSNWFISYINLVTTLDTNSGAAFVKNGTAATNDRQL